MGKLEIDASWTLFLDRDGVINERNFEGYIHTPEEFHFLPGVKEGLQILSEKFGRLIIITNQQGVGKGIMTEADLNEVHAYMQGELLKEGIELAAIFSATNLRGAEGDRRKPVSAMGLEAQAQFSGIDFAKSIMVGDTDSDIKFGKNLGMKTVLVRSKEVVKEESDWQVDNLIELAHVLEE